MESIDKILTIESDLLFICFVLAIVDKSYIWGIILLIFGIVCELASKSKTINNEKHVETIKLRESI